MQKTHHSCVTKNLKLKIIRNRHCAEGWVIQMWYDIVIIIFPLFISSQNSVQIRFSNFHCLFVFQFVHKKIFCLCFRESFPFLLKEGEASTPWTLITMSVVCCSGFRSCTFRRIYSYLICLVSLDLLNHWFLT